MARADKTNLQVIAGAISGLVLGLFIMHKPAPDIEAPEQQGRITAKPVVTDELLDRIAFAESSNNPNARNKKTGVLGHFQFKKERWLEVLYKHGAENGYPHFANPIKRLETRNKAKQIVRFDYVVENEKTLNKILDARRDEGLSRAMARAGLEENVKQLGKVIDQPSDADVYMTHHFGVSGAKKILTALQDNPRKLFKSVAGPGVCENNPAICTNQDSGKPRTVKEVRNVLREKLENAPI